MIDASACRPTRGWRCCSRCCVGAAIGCLTGFLVSKIGIPSFVVTLALFIAWHGVILQLIGERRHVSVHQQPDVLFNVANGNLSVAGQLDPVRRRRRRVRRGDHAAGTSPRRRKGPGRPADAAGAAQGRRAGACCRRGGDLAADAQPLAEPGRRQHQRRARTWCRSSWCCWWPAPTCSTGPRYGRHIYAVGGNAEAARRAGINVPKIRTSVFVICSAVAAIGAHRLHAPRSVRSARSAGGRQHAAVRGRRGGHRRHVAVRRQGPRVATPSRWRWCSPSSPTAWACSAARPRWSTSSPVWCCCSRPGRRAVPAPRGCVGALQPEHGSDQAP